MPLQERGLPPSDHLKPEPSLWPYFEPEEEIKALPSIQLAFEPQQSSLIDRHLQISHLHSMNLP
jgi:hypothetical protein